MKAPVDYNKIGSTLTPMSEVTLFTADDRVKLSLHPDGFTQFSGENSARIVSGRDPVTGEPKGLGLMAHPFSNPVRSGPTLGMQVWGLDDFDELDKESSAIVFTDDDWYYRGCSPQEATSWLIEIILFPTRYWAGVRKRGDRLILSMALYGFEASMAVVDMAVVPLEHQQVFIALFVSRGRTTFNQPSGWTMQGPGQADSSGRGHSMHAFYPREAIPTETATTLNR